MKICCRRLRRVTNYRQALHLNSAHNAAEGRRENSCGKTGQCRQTLV